MARDLSRHARLAAHWAQRLRVFECEVRMERLKRVEAPCPLALHVGVRPWLGARQPKQAAVARRAPLHLPGLTKDALGHIKLSLLSRRTVTSSEVKKVRIRVRIRVRVRVWVGVRSSWRSCGGKSKSLWRVSCTKTARMECRTSVMGRASAHRGRAHMKRHGLHGLIGARTHFQQPTPASRAPARARRTADEKAKDTAQMMRSMTG